MASLKSKEGTLTLSKLQGVGLIGLGIATGFALTKLGRFSSVRSRVGRLKLEDPIFRKYVSKEGNREIPYFEDISLKTSAKWPHEAVMVSDLSACHLYRWLMPTLKVKKALEGPPIYTLYFFYSLL